MLRPETKFAAILGCLGASLPGCAGDVHLNAQVPIQNVRAPAPTASRPIQENFLYGKPSGAAVILFDLYPRKTMRASRQELVRSLPAFTRAFWPDAGTYASVRMGVVRDVAGESVTWATMSNAEESLDFLTRAIDAIETNTPDLGPGESETASPLATLADAVGSLPRSLSAGTAPIRMHLVSFRNTDLVDGAASAAATRQALTLALSPLPFSPLRYDAHLFAYLGADTACQPTPSRRARRLQAFIAGFPADLRELCDLDDTALTQTARAMLTTDQAIVLARSPRLASLQVRVTGGDPLPREWLRVDPATHALDFTQAAIVRVGDAVEVDYEPE